MRVILQPLPDPTDVVVQGMMSIELATSLDMQPTPSGFPAACSMMGCTPASLFALPPSPTMREVYGLGNALGVFMVTAEGVDVPVLRQAEPPVFVEPAQAWQYSTVLVDKAGQLNVLADSEIEEPPTAALRAMTVEVPALTLPRAQQVGKINGVPSPYRAPQIKLPGNFYALASETYTLTLQTNDSLGAVASNLFLFETSRMATVGDAALIDAEYSASGAFTIPVPRNTEYTVVAIAPGSPALMGGDASVSPGQFVSGPTNTNVGKIYLSDPTTLSAGGGAFRVIGSGVIRRLA